MEADVAAVLDSAVMLGDEPTAQELALGDAVLQQIAERGPRTDLTGVPTIELLDELRRRALKGET